MGAGGLYTNQLANILAIISLITLGLSIYVKHLCFHSYHPTKHYTPWWRFQFLTLTISPSRRNNCCHVQKPLKKGFSNTVNPTLSNAQSTET